MGMLEGILDDECEIYIRKLRLEPYSQLYRLAVGYF